MNSPLPQNQHTRPGQRLMAATRFTRLHPRAGQQQRPVHADASGLWRAGGRFRALIAGLFMVALLGPAQALAQSCGLDIHIANDNSGSVDSTENRQARDFVSQLGLAFELGTANDKSRIAISTWAQGDDYELYNNPPGGYTYTTSPADVLAYAYSARTFGGGTNVYKALQKAAGWLVEDPIVGRTAPRVIVLMTDAFCIQVSPSITPIATQLKDSGVTIVVMALGTAAACTDLQGTNVASPGGYFSSADPSGYQNLQANALSYIQDLQTVACIDPPPSVANLTVSLDFELSGCPTDLATVNYTVKNESYSTAFNDDLEISFYNGDPTLPGSRYLFTVDEGTQSIVGNGGTYVSSVTSSTQTSLLNTSTLYAVVNIDGSVGANAVPLSPTLSGATLSWTSETVTSDNISTSATRTNAVECVPYPQLDVHVSSGGQVCGNNVTYTIQVCNTGTDYADVDPDNYLTVYPPGVYVHEEGPTLLGTDPFVGNTLPAGACANYNAVYSLENATPTATYQFSVDVEELDVTCASITGTAVVDVEAPASSGLVWMDRNLGASQAATSSTDILGYGELYQWGRCADGHQIRTSSTTTTNATTAEPGGGNAWDGLFITESVSPEDWLVPQDDTLWQGVNGTNNPCPTGYRLPTYTELGTLEASFSPNHRDGAISSPIKMPAAGSRLTNGALSGEDTLGRYWSSTVSSTDAGDLHFNGGSSLMESDPRANGYSVRCIKN